MEFCEIFNSKNTLYTCVSVRLKLSVFGGCNMDNLMFTPALDRDLGASYMARMAPMPMISPYGMGPMGPMVGGYPNSIMGERPLRPIQEDKFESIQQQKQETKKSAKKAGGIMAGIAALIAAGILIASRGKIKAKLGDMKLFQNLAQKPFFKKAGAFVKNAVTTVKDFFVNLVGKIKKKPALPPANV